MAAISHATVESLHMSARCAKVQDGASQEPATHVVHLMVTVTVNQFNSRDMSVVNVITIGSSFLVRSID